MILIAYDGSEDRRCAIDVAGGLSGAEPRIVLSVWEPFIDAVARTGEAQEAGARAIVLGTRGLTGVKSLLLGSVSHAVLKHGDRPVIVVPSSQVVHERATHRR